MRFWCLSLLQQFPSNGIHSVLPIPQSAYFYSRGSIDCDLSFISAVDQTGVGFPYTRLIIYISEFLFRSEVIDVVVGYMKYFSKETHKSNLTFCFIFLSFNALLYHLDIMLSVFRSLSMLKHA